MEGALYSIKHLFQVAREGLDDMAPAMRQAFNADTTDDRLDQVYGASPRARIIGWSVLGVVAGGIFSRLVPDLPVNEYIHWPSVAVGLIFAVLIRRYLFAGDGAARDGVRAEDFPWLAASLAAPVALLMAQSMITWVFGEIARAGAPDTGQGLFIGELLVAATHALGVAAAMTIAVAALCFSKDWPRALLDLAVRLLVFRIMVYITTLILLEIGIVGPIISGILRRFFNWRIPQWLSQLADQISYTAVMSVIYLAVIGATWVVCRRNFGELLQTGQVDILKTIADMAEDPKKKQKKMEKKRRKELKKMEKASARKDK